MVLQKLSEEMWLLLLVAQRWAGASAPLVAMAVAVLIFTKTTRHN